MSANVQIVIICIDFNHIEPENALNGNNDNVAGDKISTKITKSSNICSEIFKCYQFEQNARGQFRIKSNLIVKMYEIYSI